MNRSWAFAALAVTLEGIDFVDPARHGQPGARERGARLEVRPVREHLTGSPYSSPEWRLGPGLVRVDLLESAPGAADRMHWHPAMHDGEPGERSFDPAMARDPRAWLVDFLTRLPDHLPAPGEPGPAQDPGSLGRDAAPVAAAAEEIADAAVSVLEHTRAPWPDVTHDERGLARV